MNITQFSIIAVSLISLYLLGALLVYKQTNKKVIDQKLDLIPEEAQMLLGMIIAYPLFYNEIDIILKHACKIKVENYSNSDIR